MLPAQVRLSVTQTRYLQLAGKKNGNCFPLDILDVQRGQQKDLRKMNYKLSAEILDQGYGYSKQAFDNAKITCYDTKIYVPQSLRSRVLDRYHFYPNHHGGSKVTKQ